ncbi:hypothetical protein [Pseudovibrio sp. POLY-S9]|uniref:hypothetical protein n=1 Tax=Pseudovibrio sp. POLY-S9 TaxID=1576596 RepID=UPI000B057537|nr:hypothetical protein [Pseudovibrio sp. POLY-S9]
MASKQVLNQRIQELEEQLSQSRGFSWRQVMAVGVSVGLIVFVAGFKFGGL